ncbi:DUF1275 family protein [Paraburkholderia sp. EG287A]|uniref:DUF1275 family protein n=1 Tax=Paraburkholderia sp. EG287A TaxID=3237012 RepID=UPI0034D2D448
MPAFTRKADAGPTPVASPPVDATLLSMEERLPPILSVIARMVDLTGFFMLGNIFTAHVTGNLVIASAVAVRGGPVHAVQLLAIPVFVVSLALVWLVARLSDRTGPSLVRLLLLVQFLLIATVFAICVAAAPSSHPHSVLGGLAALIAVSAMACQYALLRLALPGAISTAVMTGNLANTVLSILDVLSSGHPLMSVDGGRLKRSLLLLLGFLLGCVVAAIAIPIMGDWTWSLPTALAAGVIVWPGRSS